MGKQAVRQEILPPLEEDGEYVVQPPKNPKYRVFADAYLRGKSATEAGLEAGFTGGNVGITASRLLKHPDVAPYIAFMRAKSTRETGYSLTKWRSELEALAHSNVQDFTRVNSDGDLEVDFTNATREQLRAVQGVKVKKRKIFSNKGELVGEEHTSEFRLWDKLRAAELLGKHSGFLKETEQKVIIDVADRLLQARQRVLGLAQQPSDEEAE